MKQVFLFGLVFSTLLLGCAWTPGDAKEEAFRNVQMSIDVTTYPLQDPDFAENQQALNNEQQMVGNRYITVETDSYLVSQLNEFGLPSNTMSYSMDGRLISLRLFSRPDYPRAAYVYCADVKCDNGEKKNKRGELIFVSFHPSENEDFYFEPDGELNAHLQY